VGDEELASEGHLDRLRTALAGLAPDQSERLVRMVELGAMICLVEEAAVGRGFAGSSLSALAAGSGGAHRRGRRPARARTRLHAAAS
jgi:hypothetical protein